MIAKPIPTHGFEIKVEQRGNMSAIDFRGIRSKKNGGVFPRKLAKKFSNHALDSFDRLIIEHGFLVEELQAICNRLLRNRNTEEELNQYFIDLLNDARKNSVIAHDDTNPRTELLKYNSPEIVESIITERKKYMRKLLRSGKTTKTDVARALRKIDEV